MTISESRGRSTDKPCRLCVRAPRILIHSPEKRFKFLDLRTSGGNASVAAGFSLRFDRIAQAKGFGYEMVLADEGGRGNGFSQEIGCSARSREKTPRTVDTARPHQTFQSYPCGSFPASF